MLLIPGIIASSYPAVGDFESISTVSGTGSNSSVTFSSIPADYQHLQIRWISKSTNAGSFNWLNFNSDTSSVYANHYLYGDGASTFVGADVNADASTFTDQALRHLKQTLLQSM